ncbi:MAG: hypothetical protein ABIA74_06000 [bacterium]
MKILFLLFSQIKHDIFLGTELELISKHLDSGDDVYVMTDYGLIDKSFFDTSGSLKNKKINQIRFDKAMSIINFPRDKIIKLQKYTCYEFPNFFENLEQLKKFEIFGVDFGSAVASSIISAFKDHQIDTIAYKGLISEMLNSSIWVYKSVTQAIENLKIDLVYIFNGRLSDSRPALRCCQQLNIPFITYEMGSTFYTYSLFKNNWAHSVDYVNNEIERAWLLDYCNRAEIAKNWFYLRRDGIQGHISFTNKQIKGWLPKRFDPSQKNIVIFNSSIYEYAAISEMQNFIYKDEMDGLMQILQSFSQRTDIKFYLRVHPHLWGIDNSQIKELNTLSYDNLEIIWPESIVDTYELMKRCNKVVTFGSTTGVEASFWNIPSILVGRAFYESLDCCYVPKNHKEVIQLVDSDVKPKPSLGALKYAFWQMFRSLPYKKFNIQEGCFGGKLLNALTIKDRTILKMFSLIDKIFR